MSIERDFTEREHLWIAAGMYCGYPMCCIMDFVNRKFDRKDFHQLLVANGEGFIPCPACAKKVIDTGMTLASLILPSRLCPLPFPEDDVLDVIRDKTLFTKLQAYYGTKVQRPLSGGGGLHRGQPRQTDRQGDGQTPED